MWIFNFSNNKLINYTFDSILCWLEQCLSISTNLKANLTCSLGNTATFRCTCSLSIFEALWRSHCTILSSRELGKALCMALLCSNQECFGHFTPLLHSRCIGAQIWLSHCFISSGPFLPLECSKPTKSYNKHIKSYNDFELGREYLAHFLYYNTLPIYLTWIHPLQVHYYEDHVLVVYVGVYVLKLWFVHSKQFFFYINKVLIIWPLACITQINKLKFKDSYLIKL